jgi:hypothetical protein
MCSDARIHKSRLVNNGWSMSASPPIAAEMLQCRE